MFFYYFMFIYWRIIDNYNKKLIAIKFITQRGLIQSRFYPETGFILEPAVSSKMVIGPYFFDASVKHDSYLKMLTDFFGRVIIKVKMSIVFIFNKSEPKHKEVQQWLTAKLGPKFLDKTMWPPRSPDINPCAYILT